MSSEWFDEVNDDNILVVKVPSDAISSSRTFHSEMEMVSSYFGLILVFNKYESPNDKDKRKIYEHLHRISGNSFMRKKDFRYRQIFHDTYNAPHLFFSVIPRGCVYAFKHEPHYVYFQLFDGTQATFNIGTDITYEHDITWSTDGVIVQLRINEDLCFVFNLEDFTFYTSEHGCSDDSRVLTKNIPKYYDFREYKSIIDVDGHKIITIFITIFIISNTVDYPEQFLDFLNFKFKI